MHIPEYFIQQASRHFGQGWVVKLPGYLDRAQDKWHLTNCRPVNNLSINLVCYAQSEIYGEVVLKLRGPDDERRNESIALKLFDGHLTCDLLAADEGTAALLLERIMPGNDLRTLPDKKEQLEVGAELIANLPIPVDATRGLPTYRQWISRAIETTRSLYDPDYRFISLMISADELFSEICPPGSPQYLLHGDLHHNNILQSNHDRWQAIDPLGVIGSPFMASARFIENHVFGVNEAHTLEELDDTVSFIAGRLDQTRRHIGSAVSILHVLSTCWGLEMNYSPERIANQVKECEGLLWYVNNL